MSTRTPVGLALLCACAALALACVRVEDFEGSPHRVFVMLGLHSNFYHSWRGDTPDEAGFGTDIRVVRELLRMLDEANAAGRDARVYWETDNHFTLEQILPEHAPDILEAIRRRVTEGRDEVLLAPYDNGLFGAMTEREMRAVLRWARSNPWGSGAADLFGRVTPWLRPNEAMVTSGIGRILADEGIEGLVLAYSGWPFNGFSTFVPRLPPEQRYGLTRVRFSDDGPALLLLPCASIGDVLNQISLERWMLDLRELQLSGQVQGDLLIHLNFDSDVESWLPQDLPRWLSWFPNSGGLPEYIAAVHKYDWAEFTTPARYLEGREPVGEVRIRRDLADGAYDGHASWAEKWPSHAIWSELERSRLDGERAEALARGAGRERAERARRQLWEGRDSSFFERLRGLSTTHFGMSTPLVNEERQAAAESIAAAARGHAQEALREVAEAHARGAAVPPDAIYALRVRDSRESGSGTARTLLRVPLVLPSPVPPLRLVALPGGAPVPFSLVAPEPLPIGRAAELWVQLELSPGETRDLALLPAARWQSYEDPLATVLGSGPLVLELEGPGAVGSLRLGEWEVGGRDFVSPFVTYASDGAPFRHEAGAWVRTPLDEERHQELARARLRGTIPFEAPDGPAVVELALDFSVPEGAPWLVVDVDVRYPYTEKRDLLHNVQQKLRRYLDLAWIEVAPLALRPQLVGSREAPLEVWRRNWLGVISSFPLDYAKVNPRNAELDAFNHQVTAGWVAVGDGERGLLVGQNADVRSVYAFAPMRLREDERRGQQLELNPFGSYHGRQLDYSHLGGTGIGTEFTTLGSSALRPNAPSYNGQRERFSLLLAPYRGARPPDGLVRDAQAFFHGPAVVYLRAPDPDVRLAEDVRRRIAAARKAVELRRTGPLAVPRALLASPGAGAVDLVWDEPDDPRIEGYELTVSRRPAGADEATSETREIPRGGRHRLEGLVDGETVGLRMRPMGHSRPAGPVPEVEVTVGAMPPVPPAHLAREAPLGLLVRTFGWGLVHLVTTP